MIVNYNKLWKLMIDRNLKKKDLTAMAGITTNAMAKMGKGENVSTEVLGKICAALECNIEDIVEFIRDENGQFFLNFIEKELWKPSSLEKEISTRILA